MDTNRCSDSRSAYGKSKRIASNSILLFLRILAVTAINLYSVRLVLAGLGATDYGIFNAVGGVITTTACISTTLTLSIQRFYSFSMGQNDYGRLRHIFSASINIIVALSLLIILLMETVGMWFLDTQMVIPADRMAAAHWVFHFSLLAFVFSVMQIPYTAAIFAHEDMGTYALMSTIDCLLRLAVAVGIGLLLADHLVFYSLGLMAVAALIFTAYAATAHTRYAECHYMPTRDRRLYRQLLNFSGWTLYGGLANVGVIQGSVILLNIFFGPVINAAFAIATQVNNAFNSLCSTLVLAFRPAMIKSYAENQTDYLMQLFYASNKFIAYTLLCVAVPLFIEMDTVLALWLKDGANATTVLFVRLVIVYIICLAMSNPITIIMQACGRIREYHLPVETIMLLCVPLSWALFRSGHGPHFVFYSMICLCLSAHVARVMCLRRYFAPFSVSRYLGAVVVPACAIAVLLSAMLWAVHQVAAAGLPRLAASLLLSPLLMCPLVYVVGMSRSERTHALALVRKTLKPRP